MWTKFFGLIKFIWRTFTKYFKDRSKTAAAELVSYRAEKVKLLSLQIRVTKQKQALNQVSCLGRQNTLLGGAWFCFYYLFKTHFSGHNKIWGWHKRMWGALPPNVPHGYGSEQKLLGMKMAEMTTNDNPTIRFSGCTPGVGICYNWHKWLQSYAAITTGCSTKTMYGQSSTTAWHVTSCERKQLDFLLSVFMTLLTSWSWSSWTSGDAHASHFPPVLISWSRYLKKANAKRNVTQGISTIRSAPCFAKHILHLTANLDVTLRQTLSLAPTKLRRFLRELRENQRNKNLISPSNNGCFSWEHQGIDVANGSGSSWCSATKRAPPSFYCKPNKKYSETTAEKIKRNEELSSKRL